MNDERYTDAPTIICDQHKEEVARADSADFVPEPGPPTLEQIEEMADFCNEAIEGINAAIEAAERRLGLLAGWVWRRNRKFDPEAQIGLCVAPFPEVTFVKLSNVPSWMKKRS